MRLQSGGGEEEGAWLMEKKNKINLGNNQNVGRGDGGAAFVGLSGR